jgi:hypothetical protein
MAKKSVLAGRSIRACVARESTLEESCEVWAATLRGGGGGSEEFFFKKCIDLWPNLPARMVHEASRTEELAERRRAHIADRAGLEVEKHPA